MMSILQSPWIAMAAGAGAIGMLLVLQLLRARPQRRAVISTLLWSVVQAETQRRTLWGRLSRWKSFALLAAILLLLSIGLSGWSWPAAANAEPIVFVLDVGRSMNSPLRSGGGTAFDQALDRLRADLSAAQGRPVAIIAAGERPRLLHTFDDASAAARLSVLDVRSSTQPSSIAAACRLAVTLTQRGRVVVYTDRPVVADVAWPAGFAERLIMQASDEVVQRPVIASIVFTPSTDGSNGKLVVRVIDSDKPARVTVTRSQSETRDEADVVIDEIVASGTATFAQMPADGRTVAIEVKNVAATVTDRCEVRLPNLARPAVWIASDVPAGLRAIVTSFARETGDRAAAAFEVVVGDAASSDRPSVRVARQARSAGTIAAQRTTFTTNPLVAGLTAGRPIAVGDIGLTSDASPLLTTEDGAVVAALSSRSGQAPGWMMLSDALFSSDSSADASLFLMIERAVRQMLGRPGAGEAIAMPAQRSIDDPTWADARAATTFALNAERGAHATSRPAASSDPALAARGFTLQPWELALIAALLALGIESILLLRRRIA